MKYQQTLINLIASDSTLMTCLRQVAQLNLASWCIGAGAIRNMVWDVLHGYETRTPLNDIDVVYYDADNVTEVTEQEQLTQLQKLAPNQPWEVVNQARVHLWYPRTMGQDVPPITSLENGLATWPETATSVGAYLSNNTIEIIAPYGLEDLFELKLRHNPVRVSRHSYEQRLQAKQFQKTWPNLMLIDY